MPLSGSSSPLGCGWPNEHTLGTGRRGEGGGGGLERGTVAAVAAVVAVAAAAQQLTAKVTPHKLISETELYLEIDARVVADDIIMDGTSSYEVTQLNSVVYSKRGN